ncbi:MAG: Wzt carbohydrate-binding domain-containing protein [Candidatus Taylorbacteria bacterium]|nr:Wzt carbohydrate-binding domain-containing protein [Candidatus Taylorbacteria bacterium]
MDAISTLTKNCLYLKEGRKICYEKTLKTITSYLQHHIDTKHQFSRINDGSKAIITKVFIKTSEANNTHIQGKTLKIYIEFFSPKGIKGASLSFQVINENGIPYMHLWTYDDILPMGRKPGYYKVVCEIPKCHLYMGRFYLKTYLVDPSIKTPLDIVDEVCPFEVTMFGHVRDHPWHADTCTYIEDCIWSASHHE